MNSKIYKAYKNNLINQNTDVDENTKTSIDILNLSPRVYNALKLKNILFVEDLLNLNYSDLKKIRNLGKASIIEIFTKVHLLGLKFNFEDNEVSDYDEDILKKYNEINDQINELKSQKKELDIKINKLKCKQEFLYDDLCYKKSYK